MSEIQQANQKKILDTIINLQSLYISDLDDQKLFDEMLLEVLRLTKSQYGFIDSLEKDDKGKTYLQALAITNIAWDKQSRDFFDTMAPLGMRFYDFNALFGPAAQKGEIVISNDVPNDPRKKGLPKGHPPINSYLAIPIQHNNEVIGVISLANRKEGYSYELVKELEVIWNSCAQLIYAYRNKVLKKEADRKLKESEEKLSNFIDQNPASIFFIRFKKPVPLTLSFEEAVEWVKQYEYIEDCNDAAAIGWGYSDKNDLVGKSSYHLLAENDEVFRSIMHAQYYNNWKVKNEETKETNTNGETVYFMNSSFLIIKDNHVHGLNMVSVNITENKKLEKEIKSIKDKLTKFIETIPSSIYFIDLIKPMPLALSNDE